MNEEQRKKLREEFLAILRVQFDTEAEHLDDVADLLLDSVFVYAGRA